MRRGRALLVVLLALAAALVAPSALAQRVVLVLPPAPDDVLREAFNRLRAELGLQGFETSVVALDADNASPDGLVLLAKREGAFAGISLNRRVGTPAAEISIADRVTGKISLRTLSLDNERDAPSVLAVRAADLLRSSLRELAADEKPPPEVLGVDRAPRAEAVRRFASEPPPRFRLDARVAALGLTQGLGPGFGPSLAISYDVADRIGVGVLVVGPAVGAAYKTDLGSASVRQELGVARLSAVAWRGAWVELRPMLAAGVFHLDASGEVSSPLVGQSSQVTSFALGLGLDASFRFSRALSAGVELSGFALAPRPGVEVLSQDRRYLFAWPFVTASTGLGVAF